VNSDVAIKKSKKSIGVKLNSQYFSQRHKAHKGHREKQENSIFSDSLNLKNSKSATELTKIKPKTMCPLRFRTFV